MYTRNEDGTFTVGYIKVMTEEQAKALLVETGVFDASKWPFTDRRQFKRAVTTEVRTGAGPNDLHHVTHFEERLS